MSIQDYDYLTILIEEVCQQRKLRLSGSSGLNSQHIVNIYEKVVNFYLTVTI